MRRFKAIDVEPGQRYGQLTVMHEAARMYQPSGQFARSFMCKCDCGQMKRVRLAHLRHDRVRSCGCIADPVHGLVGTPLHNTWRGMKMRCDNPNYAGAHIYSERGIAVCKEWSDSFLEFDKWSKANGYAEGLTIDRVDNEKGYEPSNCRWVTPKVNSRNRRCTTMVTYRAEVVSFSELVERFGLEDHSTAIRHRIHRGWTADRAFDTPIRQGAYHRRAA